MHLHSRIRVLIARASRTSFKKCAYSLTPGTLKAVVTVSHAHKFDTHHSLWEYAPTASTSLSYRNVKEVPVPGNCVSVVEPSTDGAEDFSNGKGGVAGI